MVVPDVEELTEGDPRELVIENARRKAAAVEGDLVLGADTTVALDGAILGKPADEAEARAFLTSLSGETHEVWSAIALNERTAAAVTQGHLPRHHPADRLVPGHRRMAGQSGRLRDPGQGSGPVERIEGDYSTWWASRSRSWCG